MDKRLREILIDKGSEDAMQIAVCDDEKEVRDMFAEKIGRICPGADLLEYQSGDELLQSDQEPDILLLDIQMPGRNGMETARELRRKNKKTILIFVTALDDFVFQAFDVGAFHYLVKPFDDRKFAEILQNAIKQLEGRKKDVSVSNGPAAVESTPQKLRPYVSMDIRL